MSRGTITGWPFLTERHRHDLHEIDRTSLSTGEIQVTYGCSSCPHTTTTTRDRHDDEEHR